MRSSHALQGKVQGFLDEKERLRIKSPVAHENPLNRLFELHRLHGQNMGLG